LPKTFAHLYLWSEWLQRPAFRLHLANGQATNHLSEGVSVALSKSAGLLPPGPPLRPCKPIYITSLDWYLPNRGVRAHIEIPSASLRPMIVSERVSPRPNRGEIGAKPSAGSCVKQIMELTQLGF